MSDYELAIDCEDERKSVIEKFRVALQAYLREQWPDYSVLKDGVANCVCVEIESGYEGYEWNILDPKPNGEKARVAWAGTTGYLAGMEKPLFHFFCENSLKSVFDITGEMVVKIELGDEIEVKINRGVI